MHPSSQMWTPSGPMPYECFGRSNNDTVPRVHVGVPFNRIATNDCLGTETCCTGASVPCASCPDQSIRAKSFEATISRLLQNQKDLVGEIQALRSQVGAQPKEIPEQTADDVTARGATLDLFNLVREFVDLKKREVESHERKGEFMGRRRGPAVMPCRSRFDAPPYGTSPQQASVGVAAPQTTPGPQINPHHAQMMSHYHSNMMNPHHPHMMGPHPQHMMYAYPPHMLGPLNPPTMGFPPHMMGPYHYPSMMPCCMGSCSCSPCACSRSCPYAAQATEAAKPQSYTAPEATVVPPVPVVAPVVSPLSLIAPIVPPILKAAPAVATETEEPQVVVCVEKVILVDVPPPCECKEECCKQGCCEGKSCECCKPKDVPSPCECKGECCKEGCCEGKSCECCKPKEGAASGAPAEASQTQPPAASNQSESCSVNREKQAPTA